MERNTRARLTTLIVWALVLIRSAGAVAAEHRCADFDDIGATWASSAAMNDPDVSDGEEAVKVSLLQAHTGLAANAGVPFCQESPLYQNATLTAKTTESGPLKSATCDDRDIASVHEFGRGTMGAGIVRQKYLGEPAYEDTNFATKDGVFFYDAYWCNQYGFVKTPEDAKRLYDNFTAVQAIGKQLRLQHASLVQAFSVSFLDTVEGKMNSLLEEARTKATPQDRANHLEVNGAADLAKLKMAWVVKEGWETCCVDMCLWNYCQVPTETGYVIGTGCQCRNDWYFHP